MMIQQRPHQLKGVIPPKRTEPNGLLEALRRLREFVKQYPGLGEEVKKLREQQLQELQSNGHSLAYRNQFYSGYHLNNLSNVSACLLLLKNKDSPSLSLNMLLQKLKEILGIRCKSVLM